MEGPAIPIVIVLALGIMTLFALIIMNTLAVIQIVCLDLSRLNEQNNNIILETSGNIGTKKQPEQSENSSLINNRSLEKHPR
jgi:hypothetical protein